MLVVGLYLRLLCISYFKFKILLKCYHFINSYDSFIINEEDALNYSAYFATKGDAEYVPCIIVYGCGIKF